MRKHGGGGGQVFTITGARQGLADDVRGRQRRYVISMTVRTLAVIAAAALWNVERHVAVVALVLGAVVPYVAVVIANAGRETAPKLPSTFVSAPPVAHPVLEAPRPQDRTATGTGDADGAGDTTGHGAGDAPGARPAGPDGAGERTEKLKKSSDQ
ncbi:MULTISPECIES: DUF3099 domain-containing protein [Streptomyces]|uniref:DUF3099 domain-containing protein n=2 Tax=Streptomyces TaxID=1883 RepID=A0A100Y3W8_9ACTN|nr:MULTISPECIES: DUF3099 domain-containing protein [Streptomyces]KUH37164.1 hypothetical protein ATE80_19690 [Streptomyces kanasensis]UUS30406.1 DUF3099 domain-containing protein [Streptomyces changanensis]